MGLARIESGDDGLTGTEQVMGTVDYMSPEQAAQTKGVDGRADIYSLGCTLWYLLTGKKAYEADTMIARLMAHRDGPLPSLVKARDDAPWPLEQALHKMIAKRPADRFQTMDEVVAALEPFAPGGSGSGNSHTGMGSSLGHGGPHDQELSAFLKGVGPASGVKSTRRVASKTNVEQATAQFVKEVETDPKSELSVPAPGARHPAKPQARGSGATKKPPAKLIAVGAGGTALLIALGIWLIVRDEGGRVDPGTRSMTPIATTPSVVTPITKSISPSELITSFDYMWTEPENLGPTVNSAADELSPSLTADELRFFFRRHSATSKIEFLVEAVRTMKDESWGVIQQTKGMQAAEPFISADGLTLCQTLGPDLKLRRRANLGVAWSSPVDPGPQVNSDKSERYPTLSPDGLTLFFSSDRDAQMLTDLFLSRRKGRDDNFGPPQSIGSPVNTTAYENKALPLADGGLLVWRGTSAGWHFSMPTANGWAGTRRLDDAPFTTGDLWLSSDGRTAYFASDRPGGLGEMDLWITRRVPKPQPMLVATPSSPPISFLTTIAQAAPPPGDYALEFKASNPSVPTPFGAMNTAKFPALPQALTVEGYFFVPDQANRNDVAAAVGSHHAGGGQFVGLAVDGQSLLAPTHGASQLVKTSLPLGRRFHAATVCDDGLIRLYVDGKLAGDSDWKRPIPDGVVHLGYGFVGRVDEVRISRIARYQADFVPQPRFEPDADTLVLYHCDDGAGAVVKDSSGNGLHLDLKHGAWVQADGSAIPAAPVTAPTDSDAPGALRWPLAPSTTEDIQWLLDGKCSVTVRGPAASGGGPTDTKLQPGDAIPSGPLTIVGINGHLRDEPYTTDDDLARIATFVDVESLSFSDTRVSYRASSAGLLRFASLVNLRRLNLNNFKSKATGATAILASLPQLEYLHLPHGENTSAEWAAAAAALPSITEINASDADFRDAGLAQLEKMSQLRSIDLTDNPALTRAAVDRFAAAVPGCRIVHNLGGGSRRTVIEPRVAPAAAAEAPIDVLALIDPEKHKTSLPTHTWTKSNGELQGSSAKYMALELPVVPAESYRLEMLAARTGTSGLCVGLIVGESETRFIVDQPLLDQRVSVVDSIDGIAYDTIEYTGTKYVGAVFHDDSPTRLQFEVTPQSIIAFADGKEIGRWNGQSATFDSNRYAGTYRLKPGRLWLGSYNGGFQFSKLTYTPLGAAPK
jgi:hypothetical protein